MGGCSGRSQVGSGRRGEQVTAGEQRCQPLFSSIFCDFGGWEETLQSLSSRNVFSTRWDAASSQKALTHCPSRLCRARGISRHEQPLREGPPWESGHTERSAISIYAEALCLVHVAVTLTVSSLGSLTSIGLDVLEKWRGRCHGSLSFFPTSPTLHRGWLWKLYSFGTRI